MAIGPIGGFCAFIVGLATLENTLWRKDHEGIVRFRSDSIKQFMILPFDRKNWQQNWGLLPGITFMTRLKLLNLNWVAMMGSGLFCSFGIKYIGRMML